MLVALSLLLLGAAAPPPVLLTGSLQAAEAERFAVPVTRNWNLALKWLIAEGSSVEAGEPIARFDTGGAESNLADAENELRDKLQQRALQEADGRLRQLELELELKRAEAELHKAQIDAAVPAETLKGSEHRERQLALLRAGKRFEDARLSLAAQIETQAATLGGSDVSISRLGERIRAYEKELDSLVLRATRPGIVVHEVHPWFGRKVREGDQLQASFPVASIPELATLEVEAWASEVDLPRLRVGQPARLRLDAYPDRPLDGRVITVGRAGEARPPWGRSSSYFRVRIALEQVDPALLRPGMSVRCEVSANDAG